MPKVVDHEACRREIAEKAVAVFRAQGYRRLSLRGIAGEIGVSKSSIYHYFPNKQALFSACTEVVTAPLTTIAQAPPENSEKALDQLIALFHQLRPVFEGELALLLDYLGSNNDHECGANPDMQRVWSRYQTAMAAITGNDRARPALMMLLGALLLETLDGGDVNESTLRNAMGLIVSA